MVTENGAAPESDSAPATATAVPEGSSTKPVELHPKPQSRPKKPLPTDRIAFAKQVDLLRAYGAASGGLNKAASLNEVAAIAKMSPSTITLANAFFVDAGFLIKNDAGLFTATQAVQDFIHAYQWSPETAPTKLASALSKHWAYLTLEPRLRFAHMSERDAIQLLSEAVGASPDYRSQLGLVLNYLKISGLVVQDGTMLQLGTVTPAGTTAPPAEPPEAGPGDAETPVEGTTRAPSASRPAAVSTTFTQQPEGLVQFAVSVRVDMAELSTWTPDRIAAFFGGIAQVLAAKGKVETVDGSS